MSHGDARGDSSWSKSAAYGSWRGPMSHGDARGEGSGSRSAANGTWRGPCPIETLVERAHGVEEKRMLHGESLYVSWGRSWRQLMK